MRSSLDCSICLMYGYKNFAISAVSLINASNSSNLILLLLKEFLIGLLFLNFQIVTLLGMTFIKSSFPDKEYSDSAPFRSIVSNANNSKSSLKAIY